MRRRGIRKGAAYLLAAAALSLASAQVAGAQQPAPASPPPGAGPPGTTPPVVQNADLSVRLEDEGGGSRLEEGERQIYTAHIVNNGPGTARNVQLVASTPDEFDLDEVNQEGECQTNPGGEGRMVCSYGDLAPGAEISLKFRGQFRDDEGFRTHVFVESVTPDPDPSNNSDRQGSSVHENEGGDQGPNGDQGPTKGAPAAGPVEDGEDGNDIDFFEIVVPLAMPLQSGEVGTNEVAPPTPYRFETPDDDGGDGCAAENEDPVLRLFDDEGNEIAFDDDSGEDGGYCSQIIADLEPGIYFISIEEFSREDGEGVVIPDYELEIDEGDDGVGGATTSEQEPNDNIGDANGPFTGDQTVTGSIR